MKRNATLDIARLVAAFGIVLFHSGAAGSLIGYAALPFFLQVLIVLGLPAAARQPFGDFGTTVLYDSAIKIREACPGKHDFYMLSIGCELAFSYP